ncbi:hypothetical protein ACHAQJ_003337 [Trichoderma viride]
MTDFKRWAQRLCPFGRQERLKEQDNKHKQQEQQEQQEQRRMLLTLSDLQCTMDPLMAAQVYNNNYSLLCRLPDELLLHILRCLGDDILTLYCLRRVSRSFRRLINEPDIWKHMLLPLSRRFTYTTEAYWSLPIDLKKQLKQRLQTDGMCDRCKLWCDLPVKGWFQQSIQASNLDVKRYRLYGNCKFGFRFMSDRRPHCDVCGSYQASSSSFSSYQHHKGERRCLACQGAVRLCEHVDISWATIAAHITNWQQRKPGDWQACYDDFDIACQDPSHDTRCIAEEAPTWPQARLQSAEYDQNLVVLILEWKPHSGLDAFTRTPDGQAPALELRALFRRYRQGPAGTLFPSYPTNPLPEMVCYGPTECGCLHYGKEDNKRLSAVEPSKHASFFLDDWPFGCRALHSSYRDHGHGLNGNRVCMSKHWPRGTGNSVCLVTAYERDILVCHQTDRNKIKPTHAWFHAMDPDTYPHPSARHALPVCKDKDCIYAGDNRSCVPPMKAP